MESKIGFLIWFFLMMIPLMTGRPAGDKCVLKPILSRTKKHIQMLTTELLKHEKQNITLWPEAIPELDLKNFSAEEERHRVQCGLQYMLKAVELIQKHQMDLHDSSHSIFSSLSSVKDHLNRTIQCVGHHIGHCTNLTEVGFASNWTFERKQWGLTVLKTSEAFLDHMSKIIN